MQPNLLPVCSFVFWFPVLPPRKASTTKDTKGHEGKSFHLDFETGCRYFPTISFSFFFVAGGIFLGLVRIACARAEPHLQDRARGISATVWRTTFAAFSAFFTSTSMIWSTVTES